MTERWHAHADACDRRFGDVARLARSLEGLLKEIAWDAYARMLDRERARRVAEGSYELVSRFALKAYSPPLPPPRERVY